MLFGPGGLAGPTVSASASAAERLANGTYEAEGVAAEWRWAMIAETCLKTEIRTTICGGKFRANQSFRDHVRLDGADGNMAA